ncbi:PHD finger protein ALFIN-LIKE 8-like isoform X2 [Iris pallida]|uniref:PHD finger protein ALFIN-LIKE n=1 Tax=Iris pallida TaxID=29817 RepID=A0AAX6DMK8_IRIPA|nr:PHD finger protein ALFIN-LIKE 8-like isoform X2 [Iris pallida]
MDEKDWLSLVAVHSDAWLLAVAFYFGARFGFDKDSRRRLFQMINGLPTIFEVLTGTAKKQTKEKTPTAAVRATSQIQSLHDILRRSLQKLLLRKRRKSEGGETRRRGG